MCCDPDKQNLEWTRACAALLWPSECFYHDGRVYVARVNASGQVLWAWMLHEGIPFLLRPLVAVRAGEGLRGVCKSFRCLPGCGCIVALKSKYERVRAWIRLQK